MGWEHKAGAIKETLGGLYPEKYTFDIEKNGPYAYVTYTEDKGTISKVVMDAMLEIGAEFLGAFIENGKIIFSFKIENVRVKGKKEGLGDLF